MADVGADTATRRQATADQAPNSFATRGLIVLARYSRIERTHFVRRRGGDRHNAEIEQNYSYPA
jgi:hypothetical protein